MVCSYSITTHFFTGKISGNNDECFRNVNMPYKCLRINGVYLHEKQRKTEIKKPEGRERKKKLIK